MGFCAKGAPASGWDPHRGLQNHYKEAAVSRFYYVAPGLEKSGQIV